MRGLHDLRRRTMSLNTDFGCSKKLDKCMTWDNLVQRKGFYDVPWKQEMCLFWFERSLAGRVNQKRAPAEDTKAFRRGTMNFDCLWIYLSKPWLFPFQRRWNNNKYRTKQPNLYSEHFNTWKVNCKKESKLAESDLLTPAPSAPHWNWVLNGTQRSARYLHYCH